METLSNNRAFVRIKMLGFEDIVLCFKNRYVMFYNKEILHRMITIHKLHSYNNPYNRFYLVDDKNRLVEFEDNLIHARRYVCRRDSSIALRKYRSCVYVGGV